MLRISLLAGLFAALLSISLPADAAKPVMDMIDVPVPAHLDGSQPTLDQVTEAILMGCRDRGWNASLAEPGRIKASILVRGKHYAEISIAFSRNSYSITYLNSRELDYNPRKHRIHRNYNRWVTMLSNSINRRFGVNAQGY